MEGREDGGDVSDTSSSVVTAFDDMVGLLLDL